MLEGMGNVKIYFMLLFGSDFDVIYFYYYFIFYDVFGVGKFFYWGMYVIVGSYGEY